MALFSEYEAKHESTEWYLDSACTSHMSNNLNVFVNIETNEKEIKTAEKERSINSQYEGDILVSSAIYL